MDIIKQSNNELIFATSPTAIALVKRFAPILSIFSLGVGLFWLYGAGVSKLTCNRLVESSQVECQLIRSKLMGFVTTENRLLSNIKEAKLEPKSNSKKKVFLLTDSERIFWSNHKYDASLLNNMINNPSKKELVLAKDNRIFRFIFIFSIVPIFLFASQRMFSWNGNYLTFNAKTRKLIKTEQGLFGEMAGEHPFTDIREVENRETKDRDGQTFYRVNLVLNSPNFLGLPKRIWLDNCKTEKEASALANCVRQFIDI